MIALTIFAHHSLFLSLPTRIPFATTLFEKEIENKRPDLEHGLNGQEPYVEVYH